MGWDETGWDGMGWDRMRKVRRGMGLDGMRCDGMGSDGKGVARRLRGKEWCAMGCRAVWARAGRDRASHVVARCSEMCSILHSPRTTSPGRIEASLAIAQALGPCIAPGGSACVCLGVCVFGWGRRVQTRQHEVCVEHRAAGWRVRVTSSSTRPGLWGVPWRASQSRREETFQVGTVAERRITATVPVGYWQLKDYLG